MQLNLKYTFLILLVLLSAPAFAQTEQESIQPARRVAIGISISPEHNLAQIENNLYAGSSVIKHTATGLAGFSSALNVKYAINKNLSVLGGIGYGLKRCQFKISGLNWESSYDTATRSFIDETDKTNCWFMEIQVPVMLQYKSNNQNFFISGGIETAYIFKNISESWKEYSNGIAEKKVVDYQSTMMNFAPVFSVGYNVLSKEKVLFSIEPTVKYYLKNYRVENHQEFSCFNFGLKTTWYFIH